VPPFSWYDGSWRYTGNGDRVEGAGAMKREGKFTAGDYWGWPDEERWELIDGVAYAMIPALRRIL
jgi:hypothetical protein